MMTVDPVIQSADVIHTLHVKSTQGKRLCQDGVPGRVLRDSAAELNDVFNNIINPSLIQYTAPNMKVPKQTVITTISDSMHVTLTSIISVGR